MNRFLLILLSSLLTTLALLPHEMAWAEGEMVLDKAGLEKVFFNLITDEGSLPPGNLEITNFSAKPESITLPAGPREFRPVSRSNAQGAGRQTIIADLLVNGSKRERVTLSGDLALFGDVVCAARTLSRRTLITAGDLVRVRRNLTMLGPDLLTDPSQAIGKEIKTTLQAGVPLYSRLLSEPELVKRGDIVSIQAATGAITVTVPGRVQSPGAKGELIKVKNLMSRKEIYAKVIGPETVQTEL